MSLYVLVGDDVDFYLFDEVTCTVYDDGLGLSVTEAGGELTTFFDPGSLPFTGAVIPGCTDSTACRMRCSRMEVACSLRMSSGQMMWIVMALVSRGRGRRV